MKIPGSVLLFIILLSINACKSKAPEKAPATEGFSTYRSVPPGGSAPAAKMETHYGLLTPVEISVIFERLGIPYNSAALNPVSNKDLYLSNSKAAINTGVYGADFGYLKIFGIGQEVINYMMTIREMSNKLGIPDNLLTEPIKQVRSDIADPDTITALMKKSYDDIENHLRESGRESTAGLMLMGGWVEAMYLATHLVYNPANPDPEVVQKIAEQKYTLTSLLSFMKNYYDDPVVVYYTKKLKYLKNYFDSFEIYFEKGDLEIDTVRQVLLSSGSTKMTVTVETLNKIRDYVEKLRTEMVTL
ncbi:MAG: hypothetical protein MUE74_13200 [Bacteroidales bacterium]|jgi:hypothetical protein|nr:hypothetical protein [Bacteroidales bacterium]